MGRGEAYKESTRPKAAAFLVSIHQRVEQGNHEQALNDLKGLAEDIGQGILESFDDKIIDMACEVGKAYVSLGQYRTAEKYLRHVWEIRTKMLGESNNSTILAYLDLSEVLLELGKGSLSLLAEMFNVAHSSLGAEHPVTMRCAFLLSKCQMQEGDYSSANDMLGKLVQKQQEMLGCVNTTILQTMAVLGKCSALLGNLPQSKSMLEECIQKQTAVLGSDSTEVLSSRFELADVVRRLAYDQAEGIYKDILVAQSKALGKQHAHVAITQFSLASMYFEQGRLDEVESLLLACVDVFQHALGPEHELTLTAQKNLTALRYALPDTISEGTPEVVRKMQYWTTVFWVSVIVCLLMSYGFGKLKGLWQSS